MPIYQVCVFQTHHDFFDYEGPENIPIGARVWVPFRQTTKMGIVIDQVQISKIAMPLKSMLAIVDSERLLCKHILQLCRWISQYYQSPLPMVLAFALPKLLRQGKEPQRYTETYYALALAHSEIKALIPQRALKQWQCVEYLLKKEEVSQGELNQKGFSKNILNLLLQKNILQKKEIVACPPVSKNALASSLVLNAEQQAAVTRIQEKLSGYHCFLIQGVTGSGKTEVYFQIMAQVMAKGKQVLFLVPEIGLTPQLRQRFAERFSEPMIVIHSQMSDTERHQAWNWSQAGQICLVLGTRSALFTPLPNLGLIIVDEEHDLSLKQMESVRYLARDAALMRAHRTNVPIILGSATPSLESLINTQKGKSTLLRLTQKAMNTFPLHYQIVDLRQQPFIQGLAPATHLTIQKHLAAQNQVLIFLNRRGFSPVLLCHACGWKADCPHCDARLTVHRADNQLICHHCGFHRIRPPHCLSCKSKELIYMGTGTQRVEESLGLLFPETNILRIDRDAVRNKHAFHQHLEQIHSGKAQLIVGTQMLAKGHHFSKLSLVVILDADYGFYDQDFRSLERLGQLITQVSGRAGRADTPGEVVIQTHLPEHPMLNTLIQEGYERFTEHLLNDRHQAQLPPYTFMALLRAQGKHAEKVWQFLHAIQKNAAPSEIHIMGPAPAPLAKKGGQHRLQLLFKSSSRQILQNYLTHLRTWISSQKMEAGVRWNIDVDPMEMS